MQILDWSYNQTLIDEGSDSYLGMIYQVWTLTAVGGQVNYSQSGEVIRNLIDIAEFSFALILERGMIFDDRPSITYAGRMRDIVFPILPLDSDLWSGFEFPQGFCTSDLYPFPRARNITYDPSIINLFTADPQVPTSPKQSKDNKKVLIGAIVGSLAAILAIVIIIVLVITVPAVRRFFQPFSKRRQAAGSIQIGSVGKPDTVTLEDKRPSGWTNAAKPD